MLKTPLDNKPVPVKYGRVHPWGYKQVSKLIRSNHETVCIPCKAQQQLRSAP